MIGKKIAESSSDEANDIFLTQNTFRQNVNESIDSDFACNAAEMLFDLNDDLLENICMDPLKSDNTLHYAENDAMPDHADVASNKGKEKSNLVGKPTKRASER